MDPVMLRNQALQVAMVRAKPGASLQKVMADAEAVLAWLKTDCTGSDASAQPEPANQPSTAHESETAVVGQEPKGE